MKPIQTKKGCLTTLRSFKTTATNILMLAVFIIGTSNNMYSDDNVPESSRISATNFDADIDQINLKGYSENQSDILQWEVLNTEGLECSTIQCAKSNNMDFREVAIVQPRQCSSNDKSTEFQFNCFNSDKNGIAYYKVIVTYKDKHTVESNFIYIKRKEEISGLDFSGIKNQDGQVLISFKSPKTQNVTLDVLSKSGRLLAVNSIVASEGENTFSFDASYINSTEMLIFSLNNKEEQITKKYMLASAW